MRILPPMRLALIIQLVIMRRRVFWLPAKIWQNVEVILLTGAKSLTVFQLHDFIGFAFQNEQAFKK